MKKEKELNNLNLQIDVLNNRLFQVEKKKNLVVQKIVKINRKKINSDIKNILPLINKMLRVLKNKKYPKSAVCNHFGVWSNTDYYVITLLDKEKITQISIELKNNWVEHNQITLSKQMWNKITKIINKKYKILNAWNGDKNSSSISFIIKLKSPESLRLAQSKYIAFEKPKIDFNDLFEKNMVKLEK